MKQIPTYIINLAHSTVRKRHMQNLEAVLNLSPKAHTKTDTSSQEKLFGEIQNSFLLSAYPFLQIQFIIAVNGKALSKEERRKVFDDILCLKHYGRNINDGEVRCIMSHRKCYQALLATSAFMHWC